MEVGFNRLPRRIIRLYAQSRIDGNKYGMATRRFKIKHENNTAWLDCRCSPQVQNVSANSFYSNSYNWQICGFEERKKGVVAIGGSCCFANRSKIWVDISSARKQRACEPFWSSIHEERPLKNVGINRQNTWIQAHFQYLLPLLLSILQASLNRCKEAVPRSIYYLTRINGS